jgi:hypothetical protein
VNKTVRRLVIAALTLTASGAHADDFKGFYAGLGAGSISSDASGIDRDDTGYKAFIGYSFGPLLSENELLSLELAYIRGRTERNSRITDLVRPGVLQDRILDAELDIKVIDLSAVGTVALGQSFSLFAKVGYAYIDQDFTVTARTLDGGDPMRRFSRPNRDEKFSYGGGFAYSFGKAFEARAEYEGFNPDRGNLELISLSAVYKFR